ncbi:cytosolic sulfotransferase 12-like [Vicia villosa]|uniref:cytosolic sulfotransferase 12-like n=1 Tax=Vicia villosa TaxID=3911 RepID=UPI00273AF7B3|nr:cytosolic sulfotransferase 12-like [Vicia villosa]
MEKLCDENTLVPKYLQEYDLGEECKELLATLPLEKGWITTHLHQYQGFWFAPKSLQGALSCQKHFQALDTDILLVTCPKSGTTWLKALTFALINRNKYPNIHNNHPLLTTNPHDLVPFWEIGLYYNKDCVPNLKTLSPPRIFSTHLSYESLPKSVKDSTCKVVYLCRDPKDAFVSYWHFINKLRSKQSGKLPLQEAFESFCRGVNPFGPFWEHVLGYWKKSLEGSNKVMFLKYEEMKMKPYFYLKEIAKFLQCPFSKEEESKGVVDDILNLCSFEKLSNLEVNKTGKMSYDIENKSFFRLGQVGDWKNLLTTEMIEHINTITEKKLAKHGLSF